MPFKMSLPRQVPASAPPSRPEHKPLSASAWVWFILSLALDAVLLYAATAVALVGVAYQANGWMLAGTFAVLCLLANLVYTVVKFVRRTRIDYPPQSHHPVG